MLVLTRKEGESIKIGDDVEVTVTSSGSQVRIGITAPKEVEVMRNELLKRPPTAPPVNIE